jgi:Tfp pilus assembly protein PilV
VGGDFHFASRANQTLVLEWLILDQLAADKIDMGKIAEGHHLRNSQSGITMIETLMAAAILIIGSISILTLIIDAIATNNRNKMDSTQAMLATSILEQINSTVIGSGSSSITDCGGNTWNINTQPGGATLSGSAIDFTQDISSWSTSTTAQQYFMNYVVTAPCKNDGTGAFQGTYDVRWHVDQIGTTSKTYLITVSARLKSHGEGNKFFSLPVTLRVMSGN